MVWAVLPLKDFVSAKQRLSGVLNAEERRRLFHAMVQDVLTVLAGHPAVEQTLIVSDDPSAKLLAEHYGVMCWPEPGDAIGLSAVIAQVAEQLVARQVESMLVVHGDLPLLGVEDIQRLIEQHEKLLRPALTIAPDRRGEGSNCLLVSPPNAVAFEYGKDSFSRHKMQAIQHYMAFNVLESPSVATDIDSPEDLHFLCQSSLGGEHTRRFLTEAGIDQRLETMRAVANGTENKQALLERVLAGELLNDDECLSFADDSGCHEEGNTALMAVAATLRDRVFHNTVTYSRKVFIPLTHLCRDVCHYCTFARTPKAVTSPFMSVELVLEQVRRGAAQGCKEVLFTLGEKPELRYRAAREALVTMGFQTTLEYVAHVAERVFSETGVLPHINAGCMTDEEIALLRPVSASMGIMLESAAERLCQKGMPHYGSPDKFPQVRLETIHRAGAAKVPFTSGILIGIGETRRERIEALLALRQSHQRYGHLQEIIIQNFRAKPDTKMAQAPEPDLEELLWTIAVARLIFGAQMSIQAPPNLSPGVLPQLINAGINDWGGVSPVTPDFVNPEAPWPHLDALARETATVGKYLQERLTIYPRYARQGNYWLDAGLQTPVLQMIDADGYPRVDGWSAGIANPVPFQLLKLRDNVSEKNVSRDIQRITAKAFLGIAVDEQELVRLFRARGDDFTYICAQADQLRKQVNGDAISFVVNRNINYTNICYFKCQFCAFSKGKLSENLRGRPYDLGLDEIAHRCREGWQRGATEVCMQGGIHPDYDGNTYLEILHAVKAATPDIHVHAFSPLEVWQGAATLGIPVEEFLLRLKAAGLNSLPGTAAEILDDEVRSVLCPDKINTRQWFKVMENAHSIGFKTTATMMFGHIDSYHHWARHLLRIRGLQERTGGFTEFVPLPFVAMEAPLYLRGRARRGPTFREAVLVHAVARLALSPVIDNIQTSWVKMGEEGVIACLNAGANDLGGSLMDESITRAAGAEHGQEFTPARMHAIIRGMGRTPRQRQTNYNDVSPERCWQGGHGNIIAAAN